MMPNQLFQSLQSIKANPVQFLMQQRLNIPQSVTAKGPEAILSHLVNSGMVSQEQINQAYQMMQSMGLR